MALVPRVVSHLERFAKFYKPPMLALGAARCELPGYPTAAKWFGQWVGGEYQDLDLDGGSLPLDLNTDIGLSQSHQTVFNIGTIEHVWNAHNAWANALRAVKAGGMLLSVGPVDGFKNHGLHTTSEPAIRAFVTKNGFEIVEAWHEKRTPGVNLWFAAVKHRHIERIADYEPAWQVYENGEKKAVN